MTGLGKARIDEVQTVVAAMHGLTRADFKTVTRKWAVSHPRQEAMMLARELTGCSYPQLGRAFGGMDHTSILWGVRKVSARVGADPKLAARLDECRARIAQLVTERIGKMVTMQATSTPWSPPAPARTNANGKATPPSTGMLLSKPSRVIASIDDGAWAATRVAA